MILCLAEDASGCTVLNTAMLYAGGHRWWYLQKICTVLKSFIRVGPNIFSYLVMCMYVPCTGLSFFKYENVGSSSILYMFMQMPRKLKSSTDMKSVLVHLGNHGEDDSSGTVRWKASG
jgi:hypothetical protein